MKKELRKMKKPPRKERFNKSQFVDIVCAHCQICKPADPTFCYKMYQWSPSNFMTHHYPKLLMLKIWLESSSTVGTLNVSNIINVKKFKESICDWCVGNTSDYNNSPCDRIMTCYIAFKNQFTHNAIPVSSKQHEKRIYEAYPTFFVSDNKKWTNEIREILNR